MADAQKVSPSTVYNVQGSPDDYNYILKGADLILVNKQTNEEQVFLFVGNIMSLDGQVNMEFSNGQSLDSPNLFQRSEMPDMDKQDEEAPEWEAVSDDSTPSDDEEGNSDEGNLGEGQLLNAQAALVTDPTDDILKTQQRMFDDINKFAQQESLSSTPDPIDPIQGQDIDQPDPKDDPEKPEKEIIGGGTNPPIPTPTPNSSNVTIALSQESESGIKNEDGSYKEDGITNNTDLTITGSADAGTVLDIYMDGVKIGQKTATDGTYSFGVTGVAEGDHEFYAQIADGTGESAAKSSKLEVEVDTTAPTLNNDATADSTSKVTFAEDAGKTYTNQNRPLIEGTGESDTILTITYTSTDGSVTGTLKDITVNSSGNWSYRFPEGSELADGTYTFTIAGQDDAGNALATTQQIQNVVVKTDFTTGATISLDTVSDSMGNHVQAAANDRITNETDLKLTISNIHKDARQVTVYLANADGTKTELGTASLNADKTAWTYTVDNSKIPADGTYTFMVEAMDMAGNIYQPASSLPVEVDRTAPTEGLTIDLDADSDSADSHGLLGNNTDNYTHGTEASDPDGARILHLSGTGAGSAGRVNLYFEDASGNKTLINTVGYIQAEADGSWKYTLDASTYGKAGAEQLKIIAEITDVAGNIESADLTVTVDNTAPEKSTITIAGLDPAAIETDSSGHSATVKGNSITLTGEISEKADAVIVTLYCKNADGSITEVAHSQTDGGGLLSISESGGKISWSYDVTGLVHGQDYSYYVTVEDAAGNVSDASKTFTFTSDQQISIPTIALDAASNTIGGPGTVGDNITGFVKDGSGTKDTDVEFKVTGDHDDTISVYVVDAAGTHTVTVGGVDYKCSLVGSAKNGQTVSFDASAYENDTTDLQFIAVAEDAAGNTATSAIYPVTIDDEAPVVGDIGVEDAATLGLSDVDNETNATKLTLTGTLEEGSDKLVVRVYDGVDGAGNPKYLGDATITSTGSGYKWSFDVGDDTDSAKYISQGEHNFKIIVEDAAGNQTTVPSSDTYDINIDRTDPVISAALGSGLDTGRGGSYTDDWITSIDDNLSIDVEASEGATITVTVNGHTFSHTVTDAEAAAGKINFDLSSLSLDNNKLNLGNNDVVIKATDPAGNSTTLNKTLIIDNKVDTDTSTIKLAAGSDTGVSGDNATSDHTPTMQGTTEAFALVELLIKGTDKFGHDVEYAESVTADKDGNWTITPDSAIADGSYDVTAKITDIAGNTGTISLDSQLVISSNPTAPVITMTEDTAAQYFGANTDQDWITRDSDPDFNIQKDVGTKLVVTATKAGDSAFSFSQTYDDAGELAADHIEMPTSLADGTYTFTFTTTDAYGNQTATTKTVVIDSEYDSDDMTLAIDADSDTGETDIGVNDIILTKDSTPELSGKAEAGSKARMMVISFDSEADLNASADPTSMNDDQLRSFMETNKAALVTEVTVGSDGSWVATPNLSDGDKYYKVIVVSEDQAGNVEAESISINLDTHGPAAPAINLTEDDGDVYPDSALNSITDLTPRLAGTSTTESDVTTIISITDKSGTEVLRLDASTIADASGNWEYHYGQGSNNPYLQGGEYTATITSTDKAGNATSDKVEFTILQDVAAKPTVELATDDDTNVVGDGVTSTALLAADTKLTLTGTAVAFQEVKIYDSSDNLIGTSKSGEDGVWTYDFGTNPSGVNVYYVIANGKRSDNFTLNVDNSTPDPTADLKNDTGTDGDWITNDPTIEGNVEAGSTVKVSAERVYELTDIGGGNYSYTDSTGTSHTISAADKTVIDGKDFFVSTEKYTYTVDSDNIKSDGSYETGELATILNGKDGQYRVTVNSTDVAGNSSNLVIPDVLNLDTVIEKPTIGIKAGDDSYLAPDADGDIVNSSGTKVGSYADLPAGFRNPSVAYDEDNITNDRNLVLTGDAEAGAKVLLSVTLNGTITKYEVTADENGKWECTPGNLADGKYTASVTVTDTAGNSSTSNDFSFEVDLSPTRAAYIDLADDDDTYTNDATPQLNIIGDTGAAYVLYYVDGTTGALTAVKTGTFANAYQNYTVPNASALAEGDHNYRLVTVDKAGNVQSRDYTIHVDLTPPAAAEGVTFTKIDETGSSPTTVSTYVEQTGKVVNINTNDNTTDLLVKTAAGTSLVELVRSDGQVVASGSVNGSGNALLDLTSQDMNIIDDGNYTYTLKFYDGVGNQLDANNVTVNLVVDTTDPTVTMDMSSSSDRGFNEEVGSILTSGESFTFEGKFTEDRSINYTTEMAYLIVISNGADTWTYNSLDSANQDSHIQNITVNADGTYHFDFVDSDSAHPLADGDYNVNIKAIDQAGNTSDASSVDFQLDNNDINQTQLNMTADIVGSKRYVSLEQSHYTGDNDPLTTDTHYKYELTLHDTDGHTTQTSSGDLTEGDDIELSFRDDSSTYDYAEVKITDKAGNESESQYIDLDKSDLNYSADLGKDSDVASVKASLYVDTNNNGVVDAGDTVYDSFQDVTVSDNWSKNFAALTEGNYVLQLKGYDSGGTAIDSSKTEFSFSLDDMDTGTTADDIFNTNSDQDYNGSQEGAGGNTADTTSGTHTVVDVEVHHDHIDFNIS
ncbi:Ig-like domain-containing protein [Maridesulfovibrio sp.]|uniref:Ig-like domain-containing protein n=1 Tax=Maridesulfovibrio sp. TaxID=2795000 RepID=UPI002A18C03D|nr:Ig-like domain-containing protein [Maridesulfovibrio sp.]